MDTEFVEGLVADFVAKHDLSLTEDDIAALVRKNNDLYREAAEYFIEILERCQM